MMGIEVLSIEPGKAKVAMDYGERFNNVFGRLHGGAVFSLLDEAFQLACNAHGSIAVALQLNVVYLAPAELGSRLLATAEETHATRKTALYAAKVWQEADGKAVAEATAMAYRVGKPLPFLEEGWEECGGEAPFS